jgi:pimeloyl-ACP methyl ester carboxylesterase
MKRILLPVILISICFNGIVNARILNDSIPAGRNFNKALFRLWYPDGTKSIKGIIVLMPGSNGDGRSASNDTSWQNLAAKHNFALLGCYFTDRQHPDMSIEDYCNVREGSGQALVDVIKLFAEKSGRNELANAPLVLWGHSAGGQFNYEFACWKPERVIAFVVNKGGFYYTALAPAQTRNVPGIFFTGENDMDARKDIVKGIFSMNRRAGALWTFAEEPAAGHEVGQTKALAGIFFDEVIPLRLPEMAADAAPESALRTIKQDSGIIGDFKSKTIISDKDVKNLNYPASWLVNQRFGNSWQAFIRKMPFYQSDFK